MRYQPHTEQDVRAMLETLGLEDVGALFGAIPQSLRLREPLALPPALDEQSLMRELRRLASAGGVDTLQASFLGGGIYEHFVPSVVDQLLLRGEYLTSYTPYQAEITQGTLKAIFEFQTMMAEILDLDLANASMYDGAHATAEAALMALRIKRKADRVLLSAAVNPEYQAVTRTYLDHMDGALQMAPLADGVTDLAALTARQDLDGRVAALIVQCPNFFGVVEDLEATARFCKQHDILLVVCFSEPLAWGLLQPPGAVGADIAVGEGQSFGVPPSFGGPVVGVFACRETYMRMTPGRLVSRTVDADGRDGYVLTLATREQHIRRARATSNICTNQGLMALAATIYLCLLGKQGFQELARTNFANAAHTRKLLCALDGVRPAFPGPTFNEFVLELPVPASQVVAYAAERGVAAGLDLGRIDPERSHQLLVTATEVNTRPQMELLARLVGEALRQ